MPPMSYFWFVFCSEIGHNKKVSTKGFLPVFRHFDGEGLHWASKNLLVMRETRFLDQKHRSRVKDQKPGFWRLLNREVIFR
jgi:hypothetical protein